MGIHEYCTEANPMARNRVLVQFPPELIADIDRIAGPGKRTSYLVGLAERSVKLSRQREALREARGAASVAVDSVLDEVRALDAARFEELERHRESD